MPQLTQDAVANVCTNNLATLVSSLPANPPITNGLLQDVLRAVNADVDAALLRWMKEKGKEKRQEPPEACKRLERFVNLGDSLEKYLEFGRQNPSFFPVPIQVSKIKMPLPELGTPMLPMLTGYDLVLAHWLATQVEILSLGNRFAASLFCVVGTRYARLGSQGRLHQGTVLPPAPF